MPTSDANTVEVALRLRSEGFLGPLRESGSAMRGFVGGVRGGAAEAARAASTLSAATARASGAAGSLGDKLAQSTRGIGALTRGMAAATRAVQGLLAAYAGARAVGMATAYLSDAVHVYAAWDDAVRRAGAAAGATGEQMARLREATRAMGESTRYSASQAAEAATALAQAGLSTTDAVAALGPTLELASAGTIDLADAAAIATNTLSQFRLGTRDLGAVGDLLVKASNAANTSVGDLSIALRTVGTTAAGTGNSLMQTVTVLALFANQGIKGEMAGTALRGGLAALMRPSKDAAEAIREVGLQVRSGDGRVRPFVDILRDLARAGATSSQIMRIFGQEAMAPIIGVVAGGADGIAEMESVIAAFAGTAGRVAAELEGGIGGSLRTLASAWEEVKLASIEAIKAEQADAVASLTRALGDHKDEIVGVAAAMGRVGAQLAQAAIGAAGWLDRNRELVVSLGVVSAAVPAALLLAKGLAVVEGAALAAAAATGAKGLAGAVGAAALAIKGMLAQSLAAYLFSGATGFAGLALAAGKAGLAIGAVTLAIPKIIEAAGAMVEMYRATSQAADAAAIKAREDARLSAIIQRVAADTGLAALKTGDLVAKRVALVAAIKDGTVVYDKDAKAWRLSAAAADGYAAGVARAATVREQLHQAEIQLAERQKALALEVTRVKIQTSNDTLNAARSNLELYLGLERQAADEVARLQDAAADRATSSVDRRRALRRRGMATDLDREVDKLGEALEKMERARELARRAAEAAAQGNHDEARRLAEQGRKTAEEVQRLAEGLGNVNVGLPLFDQAEETLRSLETTTVTAAQGIQDAMGEAARLSAGEVQTLTTRIQQLEEELAGLEGKETLVGLQAGADEARQQVEGLRAALAAIPASTTTTAGLDIAPLLDGAATAQRTLDALPREIETIHRIRTVEEHAGGGWAGVVPVGRYAAGGLVQWLTGGGRLPGPPSRRDTIPAMLAAGEYVVRASRAARFAPLLEAINSGSVNAIRRMLAGFAATLPRFASGGPVESSFMPRIPVIPTPAAATTGAAVGTMRLELTIPGAAPHERPIQLSGDAGELRRLDRLLRQANRGRG